jgi:hypothetical protein
MNGKPRKVVLQTEIHTSDLDRAKAALLVLEGFPTVVLDDLAEIAAIITGEPRDNAGELIAKGFADLENKAQEVAELIAFLLPFVKSLRIFEAGGDAPGSTSSRNNTPKGRLQ